MVIACPYCRTQVALDAWGTSACGHLRNGHDAVTGQPVPGVAPAAGWTPPPGAAWPPSGMGAPPSGHGPVSGAGPFSGAGPVSGAGQASGIGWTVQPAPPTRRRGGCARGCGCLAGIGLLVLVLLAVLVAIGVIGGRGTSLPGASGRLDGTLTVGSPVVVTSGTAKPGRDAAIAVPTGARGAGLEIAVPSGAYSEATRFEVSLSPLTATGYKGLVTPISDLVTVENGGAFAAQPMLVTVPVTIPEGWFALGFLVRADGTLEAMPLVAESATSVTVATRHFSSFFIGAVEAALLPAEVGTGFRAGEDDLQTVNYGTAVAPFGHCTGQSVAAVWWFTERKASGAPALWGRTDNLDRGGTPGFEEDDRTALRLATSLQEDAQFAARGAKALDWLMRADADHLQWLAFRYAMTVTSEPQLVGLYETGKHGGHEIVAYAATATGLWVADPNHPGELRSIDWNAAKGAFTPYPSSTTAATSTSNYDLIGMDGQWALFDAGEVAARWADAEDGTVGDDRFPVITIEREVVAPDGSTTYEPLADGVIDTHAPRLSFSPSTALQAPLRVTFFAGTTALRRIAGGKVGPVDIGYGNVDLGVLVEAQVAPVTPKDDGWRWLDFQRFALVAPAPSGMPTLAPATDAPPEATQPPEPAATPDDGIDCNATPPPGIAGVKWGLKCGGPISTKKP